MFSRWWILKESIRAGISAFRSTRRILSATPVPHTDPAEMERALQEFQSTVRGQVAAAVGENDPLLRLMDETLKYISDTSPKTIPAAVLGGKNVVPFPGPGRGGESRIH